MRIYTDQQNNPVTLKWSMVYSISLRSHFVSVHVRQVDLYYASEYFYHMTLSLIIMKSLDPLRAKKTFIRKKFGHTAVSAIKASSVTL